MKKIDRIRTAIFHVCRRELDHLSYLTKNTFIQDFESPSGIFQTLVEEEDLEPKMLALVVASTFYAKYEAAVQNYNTTYDIPLLFKKTRRLAYHIENATQLYSTPVLKFPESTPKNV